MAVVAAIAVVAEVLGGGFAVFLLDVLVSRRIEGVGGKVREGVKV